MTAGPVEMIPMGKRPSWPARLQFVTGPSVGDVRHAGGDDIDVAVAEWWTARARRQFIEGLWADDARASGLVAS